MKNILLLLMTILCCCRSGIASVEHTDIILDKKLKDDFVESFEVLKNALCNFLPGDITWEDLCFCAREKVEMFNKEMGERYDLIVHYGGIHRFVMMEEGARILHKKRKDVMNKYGYDMMLNIKFDDRKEVCRMFKRMAEYIGYFCKMANKEESDYGSELPKDSFVTMMLYTCKLEAEQLHRYFERGI